MESLRLILVVAGIAIILGLVIYDRRIQREDDGRPNKSGRGGSTDKEGASSVDSDIPSFEEIAHSADAPFLMEEGDEHPPMTAEAEPVDISIEEPTVEQTGLDEPVVLMLSLVMPVDQPIIGADLRHTLEVLGFQYGSMKIFHRMDRGQPLISIANLLEPGTFDTDTLEELHIPGLWIFAQLPATQAGVELVDELLEVGERLAENLVGTLSDGGRQPLTEEYRENLYRQAVSFAPIEPQRNS